MAWGTGGAQDWQASWAPTVNQSFILPQSATSNIGKYAFQVRAVSGVTGTTEPSFCQAKGCTQTDGGVTYTNIGTVGGQGPGFTIFIYRPGHGCTMINTRSGYEYRSSSSTYPAGQAVTADGIECTRAAGTVCSGSATVTMPDEFTLHDLSITRSGEYVIASPTGGEAANPPGNWNSGTLSGQVSNAVWTGSASLNINNGVWSSTATYAYHDVVVYAPNGYPGNFYTATSSVTVGCVPTNTTCWTQTEAYPLDYYYSTNSLSVSPCTDFLNCNGHQAQGYAGKVYDSHYTYALYSDPVINGLFNPGTNMLPSGLPCDFHGSWNQAGTTDSTPIGIVNTCVPAWPTGYTKAGYGEIEAVKPDGSGTTYRFAHDYNTGSSPYFSDQNNIGVISYLGDLIAFGTDMMGKRGDHSSADKVCAKKVRGMYKPLAGMDLSVGDTVYPISDNPGNYIYQATVPGTTSDDEPTGGWSQIYPTGGVTQNWGGATVQNIGSNSCRSDVVIVDALSAHAKP